MKKYGFPRKLTEMVCEMAVIDENETTDFFPVMTSVKQGCLGFLFLLMIDCVMQQTVEGERTRDSMELHYNIGGPGFC